MRATEALEEADRLMTVCNSCRYCEGLCAVFPAMELRRDFSEGDLDYLANLCHGCGACYSDCQFSPPHEFDVNVPKTLAAVREQSYARLAWPGALAGTFAHNGVVVVAVASLSIAGFVLGFVAWREPSAVVTARPGSFYALMPHDAMALLFGAAFLSACLAMAAGVARFWRRSNLALPVRPDLASWRQATRDAAALRYLDGGGVGCFNEDEHPNDTRRISHHLTFYGFLLCFASTATATLYHYLLGREAPYAWYDLPVVLGTLGGVGLVAGTSGLYVAKRRRDEALASPSGEMGIAFIALLFATGTSGLVLLLLRATAAMPVSLAVHLGSVMALFLTMPYGKFVHGIYRYAALVRYAAERRRHG